MQAAYSLVHAASQAAPRSAAAKWLMHMLSGSLEHLRSPTVSARVHALDLATPYAANSQ